MLKTKWESDLEFKLISIYKSCGIHRFLKVCSDLIFLKSGDDKKKEVNGAVCEIVLLVATYDYLKLNNLKGKVFHSLILKNLKNPSDKFRTELDFVLVTPYFCTTGECKSYFGEISILNEGLLLSNNRKTDVAHQSSMHLKYLKQYIRELSVNKNETDYPAEMFCFLYSNGLIKDKRDCKYQELLPVITVANLYSYYNHLFSKYKRKVFDYEAVCKYFKVFSSSAILYDDHRSYLNY